MNSQQKPMVTVRPTFTNEFGLVLHLYVHEVPPTPENVSPILTLHVNGEEVERRETGKNEKLTLSYECAKMADDYELAINGIAFHQGVC